MGCVLYEFSANGLQLGEVADLEALNFNLAPMFIRIPNVQFSTEPAILPNPCACCTTKCNRNKIHKKVLFYVFKCLIYRILSVN